MINRESASAALAGEQAWKEGIDARGAMEKLQQRLKAEWGSDVFNIPDEDISEAKEIAQAYLDSAEGQKNALDNIAREITSLPDPEEDEAA